MILEISCEVRRRSTRFAKRETFTTAAESLDDVTALMARQFPGAWCVKPEVRVIDEHRKPGRPRKDAA